MERFQALGLNPDDVEALHRVFSRIDGDQSGEVDLDEMLDWMDMPRTTFAKKVFSIFDEDCSGEIDFKEFVISMWNYCTMGNSALCLFAFDLYDEDSSGFIDVDEMKGMLQDIYGTNFAQSAMAQKVYGIISSGKLMPDHHDKNAPDGITITAFEQFAKTHPALLYPAFSFQHELQRRCLGCSFWERMSQSRLQITREKGTTITQFLKAQTNSNAYNDLVVEPFTGSKVDPNSVTNGDRKNMMKLIDSAGSIAARRANQGVLAKNINVVLAANKFKKGLKKESEAVRVAPAPQRQRQKKASTELDGPANVIRAQSMNTKKYLAERKGGGAVNATAVDTAMKRNVGAQGLKSQKPGFERANSLKSVRKSRERPKRPSL
jgi:Ca2+-binding EF-hand superfamily protein